MQMTPDKFVQARRKTSHIYLSNDLSCCQICLNIERIFWFCQWNGATYSNHKATPIGCSPKQLLTDNTQFIDFFINQFTPYISIAPHTLNGSPVPW